MKVLALTFVAILAVCQGAPSSNNDVQAYQPKKLGLKANQLFLQDSLDDFLDALRKYIQDGDVGAIFNLEMNPLVDDMLTSVRSEIIRGGMDPLELSDQTFQLLGIVGSIKLTSGWLQDISTIARDADVVASYNSANKQVTFSLPLSFNVLLFTYKYETRVTILTISGDVQGKIDDVHLNAQVTFDPATQDFVLDSLDMQDSGKVTVKFTGNDLVDWITNAMTSVITTVLHPVIIAILEGTVGSIADEIVVAVNEYVHEHI